MIKFDIFQWRSLKTRLTLTTLAIFLISLWLLAFYASRVLHKDMQRLLGDQQFSTATFVASDINEEISSRIEALELVAKRITPAMIRNPNTLQAMLEDRQAVFSEFNNGLAVTDIEGTVIAEYPHLPGRLGANFKERDYIIGPLRDGKMTLGKPVMSKLVHAPTFVIGVPIRDPQGKVIGVLGGVTNLQLPNFLDDITQGRYGKTGSFLLMAQQFRLIIAASDKKRVMEELPALGINPLIDQHVRGQEGTDVFVNPRGVEVLSSAKGVPAAGWIVVVWLPTEEAFAPIRDVEQRLLLATLFLTLLAGSLSWWMVRRQLAPMLATVKALALRSQSNQQPQPLPITNRDEIGKLIGSFNHLLAKLGQREAELKGSEERFRALVEWSPEAIVIHRGGKLVYLNPAAVSMMGAKSAQDLVGKSMFEWTPPGYRQSMMERVQSSYDHGVTEPLVEQQLLKFDGTVIVAEVKSVATVYNGLPAIQVAMHDITERKQMEDQIRQLAFYDPLTQLPNRRLLNDRLTQALADSKRSHRYGALMFLDLDNFKTLNDTQGHAAGDVLLKQAAQRMKACVREVDTVARLGGDEFVVMVGDLTEDKTESSSQAGSIAKKIRSTLAEPYALTVKHEGKADATVEHQCTASIGVVVFIAGQGSQEDFLKWADSAMYLAKDAGSNLIRFYETTGHA